MTDLTDLEICRRIAEIEGEIVTIKYEWDEQLRTRLCWGIEGQDRAKEFNPLTDDALCFKLMVKYKISLIQHQNNTAVYCICNHDEKQATIAMANPKRAICLAIIESKKGLITHDINR